MNKFFSLGGNSRNVTSGSPAPKKRDGASEAPFDQEQARWMQEAHSASFNAYGAVLKKEFDALHRNVKAVEQRVELVEHGVITNDQHIETLQGQVKTLNEELAKVKDEGGNLSTDTAFKEEVAKIKERLEKTAVPCEGGDLPYELRKLAVCGNLGEPTDATTAESRCKSLLKDAGVPEDSVVCIAATRDTRCNLCEVAFTNADSLRLARMKIKALHKELLADKPAWLDAKKTRLENRPNRMVHQAAEHLQASGRSSAPDLDKDMKNKQLKANGIVIGYSSSTTWTWTSQATSFFSQQELDIAKAYATQQ